MSETQEARLKRLYMRSIRRGIKEMDIILSAFAEDRLGQMDDDTLTLYDALLSENDQEIFAWVLGNETPPERFLGLMGEISAHARRKAG